MSGEPSLARPRVCRAAATCALAGLLLLAMAIRPAVAACGPVPSTYPVYGGSSMSIGNNGKVNGTNISGSGSKSLNPSTGVKGNATQTLPDIDPSVFPTNASTTDVSGASTVTPGSYRDVTVGFLGTTSFTGGTGAVFRFRTLNVSLFGTATLGSGTYYIETVDVAGLSALRVASGATARVYIKTLFDAGNLSTVAAGSGAANLQIYLYNGAQLTTGNNASFEGVIVAPGASTTIDLGNNNSITGALLSGGLVTIGNNATISYDAATRAATGALSTCAAGGSGTISSFSVAIGAASASTCSPKSITLTARDGSSATLTSYTGTVNLSTSTGRGDWSVATGVGTLSNGAANDGAATYTFVAGDAGVVTLALTNASADDLQVVAVDSTASATSATSSTINFRDNAFVLTPDTVQVAGKPQSIGVAMWRKDTTTGNCSIATGYTGTKALDAWLTRDGQDPGGAAPTVGGVSLPASAPATNAGSNNISLVFSAGQATLTLATTDVGKYVLNLRDDTRSFASGVDISGASQSITTRPFALGFTEIKQGGGTCSPAAGSVVCNAGGTATAGAKFVAAGDSFQAAVGAYLWSAADDANNDGVPDAGANVTDNTLAPSFAWTTSLSATTPITPAAGVTGALSGTTGLSQASFSGGRAVASALTYAEVGSVTLQASATNYLGTAGANVTGTSPVVGRFYPGRFYAWPLGSVTAACSAGGFSYMGQSAIGVSIVIEAQSTAGTRTQNYRKPGYAVGAVSIHAENANNGTDLGGRLSGLSPALDWTLGQYAIAAPTSIFARAAAPDGPFDALQLGVTVTDPDGAVLTARNMNPATTGDCAAAGNCTAVAIGAPTKVRFGRLRVQSASGSELLPLTVPLEAQYWNGTGFTRNTSDSCTTIPTGAIALGGYTQRSGTTLSPAPTTVSMAGGAMSGGTKVLTLSAPGSGKGGDAQIVVNLGAGASESLCVPDTFTTTGGNLSWLRGRWCGGSHDRDPAGRVTFGVRRAATAFVYQRENF
jgi:MSHA biogenesis protein MshQ